MKPVAFDYEKPRDISAAIKLLAQGNGGAKIIAGGQSLGPMLNLRLAQPQLVIDVRGIPELCGVGDSDGSIVLGSCTTHAAIEDGTVPDITRGLMREVAANIAYRAVRNRGTIGGSLCHADPAADWVSVLVLLSAVALVEGPAGRREIQAERFMTGAFATELADDEILVGIRIPKISSLGRWGHYKFCRKPGEFAEAISAVLVDPERGVCRAVMGATHGAPHVIEDAGFLADGFDTEQAFAAVQRAGMADDPYERQIHHTALKRAAMRLSAT
ncbi:MAG TPA: FAD binding domain-containing protein [Burkholderiales bacterium]|nr:FAD binding domain-containing protein [Burkholderiales bacterium]